MKKPIRLFWCTLLLIAVGIFLRCKIMGHLNFLSRTGESVEFDVNQIHLNSTLLKFAETDISDSETRQEIEILLEGNFGVYGWRRSMSSWKRYNQDLSHRRGATKIPIQLRSPLFYRVWPEVLRSLRIWSTNRRFEPGIMKELIELIKHPLERYYGLKDSDLRYSSCAVVGNSGILLNDNHGELIDSHEIVIRLNNARISGYQSNVGSKTNISFVNSNILHLCARKERCFCHPYGENIPIIMYICQPLHFLDYTLCNATHKAPLLITDARLDNLCNRIVKYYSIKQFVEETGKPIEEWSSAHDGKFFHYSSGMQAITLAIGICDRVSIFGFGKSALSKHHYHTNQKAELHLHDYEAEYAFYHDLINSKESIPFLKDSGFKIPHVVMYY